MIQPSDHGSIMSQKSDAKRAITLYTTDGRSDHTAFHTASTPTVIDSTRPSWETFPADCIHEQSPAYQTQTQAQNPFLCRHEQQRGMNGPLPPAPPPMSVPVPPGTTILINAPAAVPTSSEAAAATAGGKKKKGKKMHPFLKGLAILVGGPFAMAGACVFAAGSVIYGTGYVIMGVGDVLTGGPLKGVAKRAWKDRNNDD